MLMSVLILVAFAIAAVLIVAASRPDIFEVRRRITISAAPERIFNLINDFRSWAEWSPWEKKDPAMKRELKGPDKGVGSVYEWDGDRNVGKGRMEIRESSVPSRVVINLDFVKPFEAHNRVEFTIEPEGDSSNVAWSMRGSTPYFAKIVHLFFDMDKMVGKDFEAGLASLKAIAES